MSHDATSGSIPQGLIEQAKSDIIGTVSKYVPLKKGGKDFLALCPFHSEKTPSFTVSASKGIFQCFGCGAHGDAIDFVMQHDGVPFHEAVQSIVGGIAASGAAPQQRKTQHQPVDEWQPVTPVPDSAGEPPSQFNRRKGNEWEKLPASRRWAYRDASGAVLGYVCRFELPGGGKDLIPQSYCVNSTTGEMRWKWLSFAKPRPLYGLDKLAAYPKAQVVVCEGEKACDAAQALYEAAGIPRDKLVTVAWPGGGKAVKHVDWSPLAGRNVGLWPDADQKPYVDTHPKAGQLMPLVEQPGVACMLDIAARLEGLANNIKIIVPPAGVPDGWDLADELPPGFGLLQHTKASALPVGEFRAQHVTADPEPAVVPWEGTTSFADVAQSLAPEAPEVPQAELDEQTHLQKNKYFTVLGYDHEEYFFFVHAKQQVLCRKRGDFTRAGLLELANDVNWWEMNFPGQKAGVDLDAAFAWVIAVAHSRGVYDPTNVRGRGAWLDDGRLVYHFGDVLLVDGKETPIDAISSAYVYPRGRKLPRPHGKPLTLEEGRRLLNVSRMVRWTMQGSAVLMAGWAFLAPVCGALKWRPHIWITGAAGSGKSTIQRDFCEALTRGLSKYGQGDSTEPGIRQALRSDAVPVLLDEIESNDEREKARTESILAMMRKASSETGAETLKGTASGEGQIFQVRSMFCLASVNTKLDKQADIDRVTKLVIRVPPRDGSQIEHWVKLESELHAISSDETMPARLMARSLSMLPTTLAAVKVFIRAAAQKFSSQRMGDQYGTLIAGCWCLCNDHVPTMDEAVKLIDAYDWHEHIEDQDGDDAADALRSILSAKIRMSGSLGEVTVYELIREAHSVEREGDIDAKAADSALKRHGIRIDEQAGVLLFGTSVPNLKSLLKNTAYSTDARGQLLRLPGATRWENAVLRFNGSPSKCVSVPLSLVFDGAVAPTAVSPMTPWVTEEFPI